MSQFRKARNSWRNQNANRSDEANVESILKDNIKVTAEVYRTQEEMNAADPIYTEELSNGLLPGEVLLIDWISGRSKNSYFPRYFETNYEINAESSLDKLIKEGFVTESKEKNTLSSLNIPKLKSLLKSKHLKVGGKKDELIRRIVDNFTTNEIDSLVGEKVLIRSTSKGEKALEEFYYIVPAHRRDSKDGVYNVANAIRHVRGYNYRLNNGDISWALFLQAYMEHVEQRKYGLMRNDVHNLAMQLDREGKYEDALFHYLRVLIYDTSGLSNSEHVDHPKYMMYGMPSSKSIKRLMHELNLDEQELFCHFEEAWGKGRGEFIFHYLTKEECYKCLINSLNLNEESVKDILYYAYARVTEGETKESFRKTYGVGYPLNFDAINQD